ncbi:MAG: aldo/keto reductase [archaeon]
MDAQSTLKLNSGGKIPVLGFGTWELRGKACENAVRAAIEAGYRLIDTASFYGNEKEVGDAIAQSKVPRRELFITTKLWPSDFGSEEKALEKSLSLLQLDYVDLYLIHWPRKGRTNSWTKLAGIAESGKAKSIGVSNFTIMHLEELAKVSETVPSVNQVEFSPFLYQKGLLDYCQKKGIAVEAYSPLTRGRKLDDKRISDIARKHSKSNVQVMLRWLIQHGLVPLPKSSHEERIRENISVFDFSLSNEEMKILDSMDEGFRNTWNPEQME